MGWVRDAREYKQKCYGNYCNSVRKQGLEPVSYQEWQDIGCPKKYVNDEKANEMPVKIDSSSDKIKY